ncbi:MAG: NADP-dependent isocitrate dehydrogenase [Campylobacteraceae bacterium]|jgi:isocitrate dehydrogenase|nr:NADP-dependent isocitrate dehydrogenase [Campylobacteraceae bacterium]
MASIIYTKTDESPALAAYSLFPIIKAFGVRCDVPFEMRDISLSGRILSAFSDYPDDLAFLGNLTQNKEANIIKLPNISASIPQLKAAIKELQSQGYDIPDYPENPANAKEEETKAKYSKILGSAVNPVLREGNSDRRAPRAVKNYAKKNPHSMGEWSSKSKSHVAHMQSGDFYGSETSYVLPSDDVVFIEFINQKGEKKVLKSGLKVLKDEIIDISFMDIKALKEFFLKEITDAKAKDVLFSVHLKATMMKVSDPVIFGTAVLAFFDKLFKKYGTVLEKLGVNVNNGLSDLYAKIANLPENERAAIEQDIAAIYSEQPDIAMVDSDKGITNLHFPNDVIVDASMPAMIRAGGIMWDKNGKAQDAKAVIPDRCYADVYKAAIEECKANGALDPRVIGSVSNVGLMAQKAEEYGSHDKTFIIEDNGVIIVKNSKNETIFETKVSRGDIYRMCQTKDAPIKDWVRLAVERAKISKTPAIFWLDDKRAHDKELIKKVKTYLKEYDLSGLDISILSPYDAAKLSFKRLREGKDTISVTGNVLRDYLTDLFPILELGTSAKMLSVVPLMSGGGLFETGAGGSAPRLVQQLLDENHLRWDSLGEFLAICASLEFFAAQTNNKKAAILAKTLDNATEELLQNNKSPRSKCGELDNRGSHFYLTLYWTKALAEQKEDSKLGEFFANVYREILQNEEKILYELNSAQGQKVDIGGYYHPDDEKASSAIRASKTFNAVIDSIRGCK